ncbi:hypothetical protein B0H16DRAFT_1463068 [Mycena metata]|uniref:Uncharacterized protein n=1 Tax=Mycena metata TaxID=1033252 RepID=A0AAD7N3K7_9AGAR|nr:hypothetical protein B0H16DRAFT_1463068 [Mycena metata]
MVQKTTTILCPGSPLNDSRLLDQKIVPSVKTQENIRSRNPLNTCLSHGSLAVFNGFLDISGPNGQDNESIFAWAVLFGLRQLIHSSESKKGREIFSGHWILGNQRRSMLTTRFGASKESRAGLRGFFGPKTSLLDPCDFECIHNDLRISPSTTKGLRALVSGLMFPSTFLLGCDKKFSIRPSLCDIECRNRADRGTVLQNLPAPRKAVKFE